MRGVFGVAALLLVACDSQSHAGTASATSASSGGVATKGSGVTVIRSAAPKVSEAAFMQALDKQLDKIFAELRNKPYRSQLHMIATLGSRMQPQAIMRETRLAMGVSDISMLSLFAKKPGVSQRVGQHVQQRAKQESAKLKEVTKNLPKVVKEDCREGALKRLSLQQLAAGKRKATPADKANAPVVMLLMNECKTAAQSDDAFKCYVDATDEAALKLCK